MTHSDKLKHRCILLEGSNSTGGALLFIPQAGKLQSVLFFGIGHKRAFLLAMKAVSSIKLTLDELFVHFDKTTLFALSGVELE